MSNLEPKIKLQKEGTQKTCNIFGSPRRKEEIASFQTYTLACLDCSCKKDTTEYIQQITIKHFSVYKRHAFQHGEKMHLAQNISAEDQQKKLDEAEQSVAKSNTKKKKVINLVFFVVNIAIVVGILLYQFLGQEFVPIDGLHVNGWAVVGLILTFVAATFFEMLAMSYMLKKNTGRWRFGLTFKTYSIGRYYDCVTPLSTGGQPFQITYLKGHDVPISSALSIPLARYAFSQIVWVIASFICMIVSFTTKSYNSFVSIASIIGFVLTSFMLFLTIFLSVSKTVGKKLVVKSLKLLQKMKIVKNYEKQYEKISKYIEDFQNVMREYVTSFKDFVVLFGCYAARLIVNYVMPYFVFALFNGFESHLFLNFFVMTILIDLAASFIPLPGGTGMSEISFSAMFAPYFSGGYLFWALLIWRFLTYYVYLLQGIILLTYDMVYGNRKYKWTVKRNALAEESLFFKQEQINKFRAERNKRRKTQNKRSI